MWKQKLEPSQKWLFLMGLGACTKVYFFGIFSFTELVIFPLAPFFLIRDASYYKKIGAMPLVWLTIWMLGGCIFASFYYHVHHLVALKSCAIYYSIFAWVIAYLRAFRNSQKGLGYFFAGFFISTIISVFAFDPHIKGDLTTTVTLGQIDVEEAASGVLFWYPKIMQVVRFPLIANYLGTPSLYPMIALPLGVVMMMVISSSGRSASAMTIVSLLLIGFGRKSRRSIGAVGKHLVLGVLVLMLCGTVAKNIYAKFAAAGSLGEEAQRKYMAQSRKGSGMLDLLIAGRTEFFTTIYALFDHPIIGIGPMAPDTKGYYFDFLNKYGTGEEVERYQAYINRSGRIPLIPQHSYFTQFWGWSGISGLIFWIYIFILFYRYFKRYAPSIPQWYGYFAITIPTMTWNIFFSPYSERATFPLLIACLLIAQAIGKRRVPLTYDMFLETLKYK